jgi:c-di-GMP-binding flagellar brake protein YcgR
LKERRQYFRLETNLPASVGERQVSKFTPAQIVNISVVGAYLKPKKPFEAGRHIGVSFRLPDTSPRNTITCLAKVVWTAESKGYHCGIEFVTIKKSDRNKIAGFIKDTLEAMGYRRQ